MAGRTITRNRGAARDYPAADPDREPETPARGSRRSAAKTETPTRGRRSSAPEEKPKGTVLKGWGSYHKTAEETKGGDFAGEFRPKEGETYLIKILDDGPFAVYKEHWIERGAGKRLSFNCLKDEDGNGDCPLCDDLGHNPKAKAKVNVVDMLEDPAKQEVLIWTVGSMVGDILEHAAGEKRTSPINRHGEDERDLYWEVLLTKKGKKYTYTVTPVKGGDLPDDWDVEPMTEEDFEMFSEQGYDDSEVRFDTVEELSEIVDEVSS
jgi:hypothetical protein